MQQAPRAFDQAARTNIRDALRRYMHLHGIGTPILSWRITEADKPRGRVILRKTLQRFLTDEHHTSDQAVELCYAFVKDLPYYGQHWEVAPFAEALCAFFGHPKGETDTQAHPIPPDLRAALEGRFSEPAGREATDPSPEIEISSVGERPYMRMTETVAPASDSAARHRYEGVLATLGPMVFAVTRNALTRLPKIYWLEQLDTTGIGLPDKAFAGQVSETLFREDTQDGDCVVNRKILIQTRR